MTSSLEKALEETWRNKEKFYENTKHMSIMEILERIEGKKFNIEKIEEEKNPEEIFV
jgi:hypothetical protein